MSPALRIHSVLAINSILPTYNQSFIGHNHRCCIWYVLAVLLVVSAALRSVVTTNSLLPTYNFWKSTSYTFTMTRSIPFLGGIQKFGNLERKIGTFKTALSLLIEPISLVVTFIRLVLVRVRNILTPFAFPDWLTADAFGYNIS